MIALGAAALSRAFQSGRFTPVDALEASLARIAALNPTLNAVVAMDETGARIAAEAAARRWRNGEPLSRIDGAPLGAKANLAIRGLPWTAAIKALRNRIASTDAAAVDVLRSAGSIVFASLNMHEGALGATTTSPLYGRCINPLREGHTPGGSSGGSAAAVAAGLLAGALGTDTMGSVRIPAAYTGTCGFKPSFGRISRSGLTLLSPSLDHVGVHAASVEDLVLLFETLDGEASRADRPAPDSLRVGVLDVADVSLAPEIADAFDRALERMTRLGWRLTPVRFDGYDFSAMRRKGLLVIEAEGAAQFAPLRAEQPAGFSPGFAAMLDYGARQPAQKLAKAREALALTRQITHAAFERCDVLVCPTAPQTAFPHDDPAPDDQADLTALANFAGLPAVSIPIDGAPEGLPASLQILAPAGSDLFALAAALAFERSETP